jgi:protocatechuate 3,4-dioxygenase beta subunit
MATRSLTEQNSVEVVLGRMNIDDRRLQQVTRSLITHLHAFIREVEPTTEEWFQGVEFITRLGQMSDDKRQEVILLSDTLGVTMLVDAINHRFPEGVTESTIFGPFHRDGAPVLSHGAMIARGAELQTGMPTVVRGRVLDPDGKPIQGAKVDVWQADNAGFYDVQDDKQPDMNLRGVFISDENGAYWFKTVQPAPYPIPYDGPVGDLLRATGRSPMRPAHIHYFVTADGFEPVATHVFVAGDPYLDTDAVFGVKDSLIVEFIPNPSQDAADKYGLKAPFCEVEFDVVLKPKS